MKLRERDFKMPFPGLVPVPLCLSEFLPKIGTHLLASSDIMEKNSNSCACLRNAGSYFAEWYCTREREREREREVFIGLQNTSGGLPVALPAAGQYKISHTTIHTRACGSGNKEKIKSRTDAVRNRLYENENMHTYLVYNECQKAFVIDSQ